MYNSQQQIGYASPATHVGAYTPSGNSVQVKPVSYSAKHRCHLHVKKKKIIIILMIFTGVCSSAKSCSWIACASCYELRSTGEPIFHADEAFSCAKQRLPPTAAARELQQPKLGI
jgi:hypothetical protein